MILTINPNSALDRVLFIDEFIGGTDIVTDKTVESVGGKALDASVVLQHLGVSNLAMSFAAGENGKKLEKMLDDYGIQHDLVWVEGNTRIAHVIVEYKFRRHTHITTSGYKVKPDELYEFMRRFEENLQNATWVICGGSIPEGMPIDFYKTITETASREGVKTLIDCAGQPILQALVSKPGITKMNRSEFKRSFNVAVDSLGHLKQLAIRILEKYELPALVITCGKDGILTVLPDHSYLATSPTQLEINSAGAGDAVSAALAWRLSLNDPWEVALKWAAAISSAVVLTEGTADLLMEDVIRIYPETKVISF